MKKETPEVLAKGLRRMGLFFVLAMPALALINFFLPDVLNSRGVCVEEMKRISDEELMDIAVNLEMKMNPAEALYANDGSIFDPVFKNKIAKWLPFEDAMEFRRLNPGCCMVKSMNPNSGYKPSESERNFGSGRGYVLLNYHARYKSKEGGTIFYPQRAVFPLNNCGKIWRSN
jgi:hypothetical protein